MMLPVVGMIFSYENVNATLNICCNRVIETYLGEMKQINDLHLNVSSLVYPSSKRFECELALSIFVWVIMNRTIFSKLQFFTKLCTKNNT